MPWTYAAPKVRQILDRIDDSPDPDVVVEMKSNATKPRDQAEAACVRLRRIRIGNAGRGLDESGYSPKPDDEVDDRLPSIRAALR